MQMVLAFGRCSKGVVRMLLESSSVASQTRRCLIECSYRAVSLTARRVYQPYEGLVVKSCLGNGDTGEALNTSQERTDPILTDCHDVDTS